VSAHVFTTAIKRLCKDKLVFMVTYDIDQAAQLEKVLVIQDDLKTA
jgi:ABC-type transport system involved in cytochrome bd biosynthesis fused ATPase/permease subunit